MLGSRSLAVVCAGVVGLAGPLAVMGDAHAQSGPVVISELHYHASLDDPYDFLELTNTGSEPIDISGWSFSAGITATLPPGSVIPGGGRFVLAASAPLFSSVYGSSPDAIYTGKLSNGGEQVTLVDAGLTVMDTVTYADQPPWPASPDGSGPSLELRGLGSDNTDPENWGASTIVGGTPGTVNTLDGTAPPPQVKQLLVSPSRPEPGQATSISAKLPADSTATVTYQVMFGPEHELAMLDDQASPGGSGDGVFAATLPGQAAGDLVRYRIDASTAGVGFSAPADSDSVTYHGYTVLNPGAATALPTIEWFMPDDVYADILANHRYDDVPGAATIAYNGTVIDGALMSVKGQSTRSATKVSWKVELPAGHKLSFPSVPYPVDEFSLQRDPEAYAMLAWQTIREAGGRYTTVDRIRTQRNGQFHSVGGFLQAMDGDWRTANDVKNWAIYKGDKGSLARTSSPAVLQSKLWLDKKTRTDEDYSDVWQLSQAVDAPASEPQHQWIANNVNVPELVNYMALNSLIRHTDSGPHNWYIVRDTDGTGRWEMWHWDLDVTFKNVSTDKFGQFLTPEGTNRLLRAVLAYPDYRQMYFRRLRTLIDQFLVNEQYEAQYDAIANAYGPDMALENAKWGLGSADTFRRNFQRGLSDRREVYANNTGPGLPIPRSQSAAPRIVINELNYQPTAGDTEYVELVNPTPQAVDLSGWTIDGLGLTIQPGTVVLPGDRVVFAASDPALRAAYGPKTALVGGVYPGRLADEGETITLQQGGRTVDQVTYGTADPWPTAAAGGGSSLELADTELDNALPASWGASTNAGSPGSANGVVAAADTVAPTAASTLTATEAGEGVVLAWEAAADDRSVATYQIVRDGAIIDSVDSESLTYRDRTVSSGASYVYEVRARDRAGNTGPASPTAAVAVGAVVALAHDSFEQLDGSFWSNLWSTEDAGSSFEDVQNGAGRLSVGPGSAPFARAKLVGTDRRAAGEVLMSYTWGPEAPTSTLSMWTRASGGWVAAAKPSNGYGVVLTSGSKTLKVVKAVNSAQTTLRSVTGVQSTVAGQKQWIRLRAVGSTVQVKMWRDGTTEPSAWTVALTDTSVTSAGRPYLALSGSPSVPKSVLIDDFVLSSGS